MQSNVRLYTVTVVHFETGNVSGRCEALQKYNMKKT